jgi:hypothetical protein
VTEFDCLCEFQFYLGRFGLIGNETGPGPLTY